MSQHTRTDDRMPKRHLAAQRTTVDVKVPPEKTAKDALRSVSKSGRLLFPQQKLKRPNIRSYKNDPDGYEKARAAYNAQSPENKTRKGGGRPKKQTNQRVMRTKCKSTKRI